MTYEYKTVGAPEKGKRKRGLRSQSDRVAAAFDEILQDEVVDGWEYLRTDLLPVIESAGWFKRGHEVHRAVMVFRRPLDNAPVESDAVLRRAPSVSPRPMPAGIPAPPRMSTRATEPEVSAEPDLRLSDAVRAPGNPRPER